MIPLISRYLDTMSSEQETQNDNPLIQSSWKFHPASGALVLLLDNLFFGANALTAGMTTPVVCLLAFLTASFGVYQNQRRQGGDSAGRALLKALFAGIISGIPTSIGGTVLGAAILALSGRGKPEQEPMKQAQKAEE